MVKHSELTYREIQQNISNSSQMKYLFDRFHTFQSEQIMAQNVTTCCILNVWKNPEVGARK